MAKKILFEGDSITDSSRRRDDSSYSLGCGYPTLVKAELGGKFPLEYEFYNRGVSGDKVLDMYARAHRDMFAIKPDYMSILIGVNDVWHCLGGVGDFVDRYEKVYSLLIKDIKENMPQTKIMILEPFVLRGTATDDTEGDPERFGKFLNGVLGVAAVSEKIAKENDLVFVPLQKVFDEACKLAPPKYWLIDGVHPTAMGHNLIKEEWLKAFERMV